MGTERTMNFERMIFSIQLPVLMVVLVFVMVFGIFGMAGQAQAAVDCTTVTAGPSVSATHNSYTISNHPVSGSDRLLLVLAQGEGDQTDPDVSTVVFNGATNLTQFHVAGPTRGVYVQIWYALNPPLATGDVVLTYGGNTDNSGATAVTCAGVDQSTGPMIALGAVASALSTGSGTTTNLGGITTTYTNSMLVGAVTGDGGDTFPHTPVDGQTETWDFRSGTSGFSDTAYAGGYLAAPTVGLYNFDWDQNVSDDWAVAVVEAVPVQCTDTTPSNLTITVPPANNSTVSGNVTITATADENMSNHTVTVSGTTGGTCDVAAATMTESGTGPWTYTYSWNTGACGNPAENPITISVDADEPECGFAQNATWNNITIDNTCVASAPIDLADTSVTSSQVDLQWSGSNCGAGGNDYYIVYRDGSPLTGLCDNITCVAGTNNMTCSDTSVSPDTSYAYTVRGYNITDTCESADSNTVNVTTPVYPYAFSGGTCGGCHTYPPTDGTRDGATGAFVGDHQIHLTICSTCHIVPATETSADYDHRDENITMATSGGTGVEISGGYYDKDASTTYNAAADDEWAQTNTVTTSTCRTVACHGGTGSVSAQWGIGTEDCTTCHNAAINSPVANGLGGPTQRRAIVPEFSGTWSHKRSGGAVTAADCGVCHMEGTASSGRVDWTYHADGYVDLRDPDTGTTIQGATWGGAGAGSYTSSGSGRFVQFSRNLSSATLEANVTAIQINFCLKCHDSDGALSPSAWVPGGTAGKPFNTTIAHTPGGDVLDVDLHFNVTNQSYHPVKGKQNNSYADQDLMSAPWNQFNKTPGTTDQWGDLISCWDCHADPADSGTITYTVTAHGGAETLRGYPVATNSSTGVPLSGNSTPAAGDAPTLCLLCHPYTGQNNPPGHGPNSAATDLDRNEKHEFLQWGCNICHSSDWETVVTRPTRSEDVHGTDVVPDSTNGNVKSGRWASGPDFGPVSFIRNSNQFDVHAPASIGSNNYTPICMGGSNGNSNCTRGNTEAYTVGGTY